MPPRLWVQAAPALFSRCSEGVCEAHRANPGWAPPIDLGSAITPGPSWPLRTSVALFPGRLRMKEGSGPPLSPQSPRRITDGTWGSAAAWHCHSLPGTVCLAVALQPRSFSLLADDGKLSPRGCRRGSVPSLPSSSSAADVYCAYRLPLFPTLFLPVLGRAAHISLSPALSALPSRLLPNSSASPWAQTV